MCQYFVDNVIRVSTTIGTTFPMFTAIYPFLIIKHISNLEIVKLVGVPWIIIVCLTHFLITFKFIDQIKAAFHRNPLKVFGQC